MTILFFLLLIVVLYVLSFKLDFSSGHPRFGVTFSQFFVEEATKLDWRETYKAILDDLNPELLRLVAYWQYLEPQSGEFEFDDLDWQIKEAAARNKEVVLVIGNRVPRWPECHAPKWAKNLEREDFRVALLGYLEKVVDHYKNFPNIKAWQVENEPLLSVFGECPRPDAELLKKEVAVVKKADTRPVIITDSGELSLWLRTSRYADVLGTTFYRIIWNKKFGWTHNYYSPILYWLRATIVKSLYGVKDVIVSELQAEPWTKGGGHITFLPAEEQIDHFVIKDLETNIRLARMTGFKDIYLWGVEWWYWRKINGDDAWWNYSRELFKK